jgi:polyhydroxybutyrate depolymerase
MRRIIIPLLAVTLSGWSLAAPKSDRQAQTHTIKVGDRERSYIVHLPSRLPKDKPVALVLAFHGGGGQAAGMERMTGFGKLADKEGFLVVYPEGISKNWNDGRENPNSVAFKEKVDDVAFVAALIDALGKQHKIDAKRVYATGISNGAIFSHYLAAKLSGKIAAIAPVVGGIADPFHKEFSPEKPVSVLILQGTKDPLVPYEGGPIRPGKRGKVIGTDEAVRLWVRHNGCQAKAIEEELPDTDPKDGCTVKRFRYEKGQAGTEVVLYKIEGGGHTWPGGIQYLSEKLIGKVCRDFDGTTVIWEFFRKHPKP